MRKLVVPLAVAVCFFAQVFAQEAAKTPTETRIEGSGGTSFVVRMQGPYDADVPLQVVCYFRHTPDSDSRMAGAPVELDRRLGGIIGSLRSRGEFSGDELETLLIDAPEGTIKPRRLLLIGLGEESALSLGLMERVGRVALREASRLGAKKVAFAPLIRDQGNRSLAAGDVGETVIRGVLLALGTQRYLHGQGFAAPYTLEEWVMEAGPAYFDETVAGVKKAIAADQSVSRPAEAHSTKSR